MILPAAAAERRSPPEAALQPVHRDQLLDLIERIAPALPTPVSDGALRLLRVMAKQTPPRAWAEPDADPCCYMQQAELCQVTGRAPATVRRHEHELLAAGLIDKRTAANGARSGFLGCGIFFGRLVHRLAEFRALDARLSAEREQHAHLRGRRSIHKRHLRAALAALADAGHAAAPAITAQLQGWPSADQLHRMTLTELRSHVEAADALCREAIEIADNLEESSGGPLIFERPYIQDTTQEDLVSCITPDGSVDAAIAHHVLGGADEIVEGQPAGFAAGVQVHAETLAGELVEPHRAEPGEIIACAAGGAFGIILF